MKSNPYDHARFTPLITDGAYVQNLVITKLFLIVIALLQFPINAQVVFTDFYYESKAGMYF